MANNSKVKKVIQILLCYQLLTITGSTTCVLSQETDSIIELKNQIKKEIYQELFGQILAAIKKEVHNEFRNYFKKGGRPIDKYPLFTKNLTIKKALNHRVQDEISQAHQLFSDHGIKVSDIELDAYHASGFSTQAKLPSGIQKSLTAGEIYLASAANTASTTDDETLSEITAGEEKPESIERVLKQRGSMLLPKGTLQFEPSIIYSHFSTNRINVDGLLLLDVFAIGEISTESIQRDIFIQTFGFKYGLLDNFQAETRIPFREEHDRYTKTSGSESTDYSSGIGDIEISASRQIGWEDGWMPDLIANLSVKTTSGRDPYNRNIGMGTGHWGLRGSLIAAKSSDPVVIFGSLSYTYNFERDNIENLGDIDPGDSIAYSFGTAIALSYKTAINFAFSHSLTTKTLRNGEAVPGSFLNVAALKIGLNWALNERASIDCGVSIGITESAPDLTLELRFPMTF